MELGFRFFQHPTYEEEEVDRVIAISDTETQKTLPLYYTAPISVKQNKPMIPEGFKADVEENAEFMRDFKGKKVTQLFLRCVPISHYQFQLIYSVNRFAPLHGL